MDTITSLPDLWAALPELAAEARARATEFEARRSLPPDFADRLKRAGVFKLLVRAGPGGANVGTIQRMLKVPATTLAHHLGTLTHAGLAPGPRVR